MSKPTLSTIANKAGVSKSTVSLALRNDSRVSESLKMKIQKIAREQGYQSNALLAQLMGELRKSNSGKYIATLAAISLNPEVKKNRNAASTLLVQGYTQQARQHGYEINEFRLSDAPQSIQQYSTRLSKILKARTIKGVIFYDVRNESDLADCRSIWENQACIVIGPRIQSPALNFVTVDHFYTAKLACEKMIYAGYSKVGIVLDAWVDNIMEHRLVAAYNTIRMEKPQWPPVLTLNEMRDNARLNDRRRFADWISCYKPDACLCLNNFIPEWLNDLGYRYPEDIGVAMLDLNEDSRHIGTGINQRMECLGKKAADLVIGQINRGETSIPSFQAGTLITGEWVRGPTIRQQ